MAAEEHEATVAPEAPPCPYDGSPSIRYGTYEGHQRFWCKSCKRKFTSADTFFHGHHDRDLIAQVLTYYFNGASMQKVADIASGVSGKSLSKAQVYRWIVKFSGIAAAWAMTLTPKVGDRWVADETVLKVGGNPRDKSRPWDNPDWWFWDIIDTKTRLLLSSHFTRTRKKVHSIKFLTQARDAAGFSPTSIRTDKLTIYPSAVLEVFGSGTRHLQSRGFGSDSNINLIERFHGTLKGRTKVMRWFKNPDSAAAILGGFIVHYNFFSRHESLDGASPARVAGIAEGVTNWRELLEAAVPACRTKPGMVGCLKKLVNVKEWAATA